MKIALINNVYSHSASGGAERIAEKIAVGLKSRGHEVFVVACAAQEEIAGEVFYLKSIFPNLGKYPLAIRFFRHFWDFFSPGHAKSLKKILLAEGPDLVVTNNLKGVGFFVPGLLRKLKIRHFHILHDIQLLHPSGLMLWKKEKIISTFQAKIYQALTSLFFGSPEIVISPSKWLLDLHTAKWFFKNTKKIAIPNFFSTKNNIPDSKFQIPNSRFQFLFVGKLEEHKGVKFLVKTFVKFLEKNLASELLIVGAGEQQEELKKISANYPAIKFLGLKNYQGIEDLMASSNCFVMPSLCYENSPTVIYEAIAARLPVIASCLGGIPELIKGAGGWLFEPENEQELLEKMSLAVSAPLVLEKIKDQEKNWQPEDFIEVLSRLAEKTQK